MAILCRAFSMPIGVCVRVGLLLSQGGEFGFILFLSASALGLLEPATMQILLAGITLSMVATPAMAFIGSWFFSAWAKREPLEVAAAEEIAEDLTDHVLIAGFGRVGQTIAKILSAGGISYVAIDMDAKRIAACRAKGMPVFFGDASQIEILNSAGAERAKGAIVTIDRHATADHIVAALNEYFPDLPIFARAQDLPHGRSLETLGVTQAVPETLEASLQLGAIAMTSMGTSSDEVLGIIQDLREDDYANLGDPVQG